MVNSVKMVGSLGGLNEVKEMLWSGCWYGRILGCVKEWVLAIDFRGIVLMG